ncbi:MAG: hypothetical protein ACEPOZ_05910 [Marinifilaceae bacterium]
MAHTDDLNALLETLNAIPKENLKPLNMPAKTATQEAENLYYWANKDLAELQRAGLGETKIAQLLVRAGALHQAQSDWIDEKHEKENSEILWKEETPMAFDLQAELEHTFRFAYRNDEARRKSIQEIAEGNGHDDLIQDLNDYANIGRKHPEPLQAINFDMTKLDLAADTSDRLAGLLAQVNGARETNSEAKLLRDRAYTHLKELVDEIREYGKFVFWKDAEKLEHYSSGYHRKTSNKRKEEEIHQ